MSLNEAEESKSKKAAAWTEQEDALLCAVVDELGTKNWTAVADRIGGGRSGKSCRLRWYNQLDPSVNKLPFTEWEQAVIFKAQEVPKYANRWASVARLLQRRTDNAVKNHWNATLTRRVRRGTFKNRYLDEGVSLEWLLANPELRAPEEIAAGATSKRVMATVRGPRGVRKRTRRPRRRRAGVDAEKDATNTGVAAGAASCSPSSTGNEPTAVERAPSQALLQPQITATGGAAAPVQQQLQPQQEEQEQRGAQQGSHSDPPAHSSSHKAMPPRAGEACAEQAVMEQAVGERQTPNPWDRAMAAGMGGPEQQSVAESAFARRQGLPVTGSIPRDSCATTAVPPPGKPFHSFAGVIGNSAMQATPPSVYSAPPALGGTANTPQSGLLQAPTGPVFATPTGAGLQQQLGVPASCQTSSSMDRAASGLADSVAVLCTSYEASGGQRQSEAAFAHQGPWRAQDMERWRLAPIASHHAVSLRQQAQQHEQEQQRLHYQRHQPPPLLLQRHRSAPGVLSYDGTSPGGVALPCGSSTAQDVLQREEQLLQQRWQRQQALQVLLDQQEQEQRVRMHQLAEQQALIDQRMQHQQQQHALPLWAPQAPAPVQPGVAGSLATACAFPMFPQALQGAAESFHGCGPLPPPLQLAPPLMAGSMQQPPLQLLPAARAIAAGLPGHAPPPCGRSPPARNACMLQTHGSANSASAPLPSQLLAQSPHHHSSAPDLCNIGFGMSSPPSAESQGANAANRLVAAVGAVSPVHLAEWDCFDILI